MSYYIPEDGYDTRLSQALSAGDTTAYVNTLPVAVTGGYLTIFELDGITIRAKIKFTGVASSPTRLTGVSFVSLTAVSDTPVTGTDCPKNSRIALTDNLHYTGRALAIMNGTIETGGVMKLPTARTISDPRHTIDKEYADGLAIAGYSSFFVTQDGADPSLAVNVAAGQYIKADGTSDYFAGAAAQAVTDDATNYVEISPAGAVSINTSAFTAGSFPLAVVVAASGDITSISDRRALLGQNDGTVDKVRTWGTVQSAIANNIQITTDADSANDAVRQSFMRADAQRALASGTSGEAFAIGDALYLKASDSKLYKADSDADESTFSFVGIAQEEATAADETKLYSRPGGIATGLTGLTAGSYYYITAAAGTIGVAPGARYAKIGQALSTTTLRVTEPKFIVSGSATITSATTFVQTTGFYPAHIDILAGSQDLFGTSQGTDSNTSIAQYNDGNTFRFVPVVDKAWYTKYNAFGVKTNSGTVSAKSATGFTLNCDTFTAPGVGLYTVIYWTAYSE